MVSINAWLDFLALRVSRIFTKCSLTSVRKTILAPACRRWRRYRLARGMVQRLRR